MTRGLAPMIGLLAALAPAMAHAQTNIDQGKTPAQIFVEALRRPATKPHAGSRTAREAMR